MVDPDRELVANEPAATSGQDRWAAGQACPLLLAATCRGASASTPVRVDAPADLGAASAERIAFRLRLQNLGLREEGRSGVWELECASASGAGQTGKNKLSEPRDFSGVGSGGKFVLNLFDSVPFSPH